MKNAFNDQLNYWIHMLDESQQPFLLTEGDHWPDDYLRKTSQKLQKLPFVQNANTAEDVARKIMKAFDEHAFDEKPHIQNSLLTYFNTVVKWIVQYSKSQAKFDEFLKNILPKIVQNLKDIGTDVENEKNLRTQIKSMSLEKFQELVEKLTQQNDTAETTGLQAQNFDGQRHYDIFPIESFQQLNNMFGGKWTGNGTGDVTAWCHTNDRTTYDDWIDGGKFMLYVLAKPNWKDIAFNPNPSNAFDDYGSSLIAILVNTSNGKLAKSTLRYNHICEIKGRTVDGAFKDWADLNAACRQDIRTEIISPMMQSIQHKQNLANQANAAAVQIMSSVDTITSSTFDDSIRSNATKIVVPANVVNILYQAFAYFPMLESVEILGDVKELGEGSFSDCNSLEDVKLPTTLKTIGSRSFYKCKSLQNFHIPDGTTRIGGEVFYECNQLTSIYIPPTIRHIGQKAFERCMVLDNVKIPEGVEDIPQAVFANCQGMTKIELPSTLHSIGFFAFLGCDHLQQIEIPDSVQNIGGGAFIWCKAMKKIKFPALIQNVAYGTFDHCDSVSTVVVGNNVMARKARSMFPRANVEIRTQSQNTQTQLQEAIRNLIYKLNYTGL